MRQAKVLASAQGRERKGCARKSFFMKPAVAMKLIDGSTAVVCSDVMHRLMSMVERVARQDAAVLVVGETGVGKEMIAQAIHQHSLRCGKSFVDVNCAAFPEHLVESELFGYEKGAFSGAEATKPGLFELADQGTLFLDEVGELDAKVQAKLLRVLDGVPYYRLGGSRKVDVNVRVITATNRDLEAEVHQGKFRRDLFHRLTQFQLRVPPLRERPEDIAPLVKHYVKVFAERMGKRIDHIPAETLAKFESYSWPGNVRELQNLVERAVILSNDGILQNPVPPMRTEVYASSGLDAALKENERALILQMLESVGWVIGGRNGAAARLGLKRTTLLARMNKLGITRPGVSFSRRDMQHVTVPSST